MLFEDSRLEQEGSSPPRTNRRVWDGTVCGTPDFWVVVTPPSERPTEWLQREDVLEVSPLRVCHAILDDRYLVLGDTDPEHDELFSDLLGML